MAVRTRIRRHEALTERFQLEYGSGNASGSTMRETLALGRLSLASVRMGGATRTSPHLQRFRADGIVGLGLEALSLVTKPSLFVAVATLQSSTVSTAAEDSDKDLTALLARFSVYVNPLPGLEPPSQLIFGGADSSLVRRDSDTAANAVQWHHFPVIPFPDQHSHGFWSLRLLELALVGDSTHTTATTTRSNDTLGQRMRRSESDNAERHHLSRHAVAIVDSGTSVLLLPTRVFERTLAATQQHLARHYDGLQMHASAFAVSGFACTQCSPAMFPSLAFTFQAADDREQTLTLQGVDYVRCDGDACAPQLDAHALFHAADDSNDDVIVLGALFLRAYYALFDVHARRVGFACGDNGACRGGQNPVLQFDGDAGDLTVDSRVRASLAFWTHVYFTLGVLLLAVAGVLVWTMLSPEGDGGSGRDNASESHGPLLKERPTSVFMQRATGVTCVTRPERLRSVDLE